MDTVLNLGLNEETLQGLDRADRQRALRLGRLPPLHPDVRPHRAWTSTGEKFDHALDAAKDARGVEAGHGPRRRRAARASSTSSSGIVAARRPAATSRRTRYEQLDLAIKAVFASWFGKRARDYREYNKIAARPRHGRQRRDDGLRQHGRRLGHRRRVHARPEHRREGALRRVPDQRPGRGRRRRHPHAAADQPDAATSMPEVYAEFQRIAERLEQHYHDVQDLEFTIERGRLYMLQTRSAKRTAARRREDRGRHGRRGHHHRARGAAAHRAGAGRPAAARPVRPDRQARGDERDRRRASTRRPARPWARPCSTPIAPPRWRRQGEKVILVRIETSPDDFHGMAAAQGVLTARGGATSPRGRGRAPDRQAVRRGLRGAGHRLRRRERAQRRRPGFSEGRLDLARRHRPARCSSAQLPTIEARFEDQAELQQVLELGRRERAASRSGPTPTSPRRPRWRARYGAQGIGLCRTEHMFREGERLDIVRDAILVAFQATRAKEQAVPPARRSTPRTTPTRSTRFDAAMAKLEALQEGDFEGIFEAMDGLPVVIRLIDPPLHEFLPNHEELLVEVTRLRGQRAPTTTRASSRSASCSRAVEALREQNPMLGLRGCRLGLMIPDLVKMQTRAILNAAIAVREGRRRPARRDHDPARRPRERAGRHAQTILEAEAPRWSRTRPASRSTTSSAR